ncbi:MAG: BMC domain-containing protein [Clostridia bacterium]|nr:BMC domain-containing protein [Clostridia bacterium]
MDIYIIKQPSKGTLDILQRRGVLIKQDGLEFGSGAVGLVQGRMIEMVVAGDIAEKASGVVVEDIKGSCPQNMVLLAIFGDIASVESALNLIKEKMAEYQY